MHLELVACWYLLHGARRWLRQDIEAPIALFYDNTQRPSFRTDRLDPRRIAKALAQPAFVSLPAGKRYTRQILEFLQTLDDDGTTELVAGLRGAEDLPERPPVEIHEAEKSGKEIPELVERIGSKKVTVTRKRFCGCTSGVTWSTPRWEGWKAC